jgi:hypothetical protein
MAVLARNGSDSCSELASSVCRSGSVVPSIDRFLRDRFIYRDERDEVLRDVPFMLNDLQTTGYMMGDCDDMTIMCCSLLMASGMSCRMTAIKSDNPDEFDHVFSEANTPAGWIPIDPTVPYGTRYMQYGYMSEPVC